LGLQPLLKGDAWLYLVAYQLLSTLAANVKSFGFLEQLIGRFFSLSW
jgi:hypothetical protein